MVIMAQTIRSRFRVGEVVITSQNHGFAVAQSSLPEHLKCTHKSLFDGTVQGIRHTQRPAFGFQGTLKRSGPQDCDIYSINSSI